MPVTPRKVIVTTTINSPTEALLKFDAMPGWLLIVVGDRKTPPMPGLNGIYLSPATQESMDKELSDAIGWNCIQRRNFGFLLASELGADIVATVDDDNIPYEDWGNNLLVNQRVTVKSYATESTSGVFDPVGCTEYAHLWHRGFPLELLTKRDYDKVTALSTIPDVQADFWNGDPDIDAICRMQFQPDCTFNPSKFPVTCDGIGPFNSQNTFISAKLLEHYFMFPHVGRMDDIWASYYLQSVVPTRVVWNAPSVVQARNQHDLIKDMQAEYCGYEKNLALIRDLREDPERLFKYLPEQAAKAFRLYQRHFK